MIEETANTPDLWKDALPALAYDAHKYMRGHVVIFGGDDMTGAARMASESAMRIGAGICTIIAGEKSLPVYKSGAPHIICREYTDTVLGEVIDPDRRQAFLIGSGYGRQYPERLKKMVMQLLVSGKPLVLDADALTVFGDEPYTLLERLHDKVILTPHEGEFSKLFGENDEAREERVNKAVEKVKGVLLLKGAETLIATNREIVRNTHASPYLATAGAGDVLAGMIAGLMAQGMTPIKAASVAVWVHGEASMRLGAGMVAPDIIKKIPAILQDLA